MGEFMLGLIFGCIAAALISVSMDKDSGVVKKEIAYGDKVCESFGGLKSHDDMGNYTCNNNLVITGDNHE